MARNRNRISFRKTSPLEEGARKRIRSNTRKQDTTVPKQEPLEMKEEMGKLSKLEINANEMLKDII